MSDRPAARSVHLLVPAGYADPARASGGNRYDHEIAQGLRALGWSVVVHEVAHSWPTPTRDLGSAAAAALGRLPDGAVVLVDGLVASAAAAAMVDGSARLRLVVIVHMPGAPGGPSSEVLRSAGRVVATSAATARRLEQTHRLRPGSVLVACPGVAAAQVAEGTAGGTRLLCVAAVTHLKGQDVLASALATVRDRPWTLDLVGDLDREPAYVDSLRHDLDQRGLTGRVWLVGPLQGSALEAAYASADLLVLPSRAESYGLVVTEALARGLPVVATDVGGVSEALGQAADGRVPGLLVSADDPTALAAALARWLHDADLRAELRCAARSRRDRLVGWASPVAEIDALLRGVGGRGDVGFASAPLMNRSDLLGVSLT